MTDKDKLIPTFVILGLGAVVGSLGFETLRFRSNYIPNVRDVQSGYVSPLDIKVRCEDLDKSDGKSFPETYVDIGGKSYILRYDSENKPTLMEYDALVPKYKAEKETK